MQQESIRIYRKDKDDLLDNNLINEKKAITGMIYDMALESEGKELSKETVSKSVENILNNSQYGHYFVIIDHSINKFCGLNLITYEYNINLDTSIMWIQSVYVDTNYRMKGLFRKLLNTNELYAKDKIDSFKQILKLYMDKDNTNAEQVYFKVGFKVTNEILYELDYSFDNIDFLKDNFNYQNADHYELKPLNISNINLLDTEIFHSLYTNKKFDFKKNFNSIQKVISDDALGKIILVIFDGIVIGTFFIFYEYSDWRNSIFWWVYDFIVNDNYRSSLDNNTNMQSIIYSLVKYNYDNKSCGLRYLAIPEIEYLLKNTVLQKSHYIIYEKKI